MLLHLVASVYIVMLPMRSQQNASNFFRYIDKTVRQYKSVFSGTCIGFDLFVKASRLVISVQKCDLLTGLDALSNVLVLKI